MKNNFKHIALVVVAILIFYVGVASFLLYSDYNYSLDKTVKTSDNYSVQKASQIVSYIDLHIANAAVLSDMLASAKEKNGAGISSYVEQ
ncbi:MAG: hypothetical protein IIU03_13405, partial [Bacteroidales bacterium]|nr:hypothetical protein [Bacteroidales bacterium]